MHIKDFGVNYFLNQIANLVQTRLIEFNHISTYIIKSFISIE